MRIGQIAKLGGCTVETVRYYEKEGLIAAPGRQANGYRYYNKSNQPPSSSVMKLVN